MRFLNKIISLFLIFPIQSVGQETIIYDSSIKTVQFRSRQIDGRSQPVFPIIDFGKREKFELSFDELTHEYHRYTYTIEFLDEKFKAESSIFKQDYIESTSDEGIVDDYIQSLNTSVPYTHYSITFPNEYIRPKLPGNYKITIWKDSDSGEKVRAFDAFFFVVDQLSSFDAKIDSDTDVDRNKNHQQLTISAACPTLPIRNIRNFTLIVLQNKQWHNAVRICSPTSFVLTPRQTLVWEHCKDLIFDAGNEYRKFEIPSVRYPSMHVESIKYLSSYYHATLFTDEPRLNYLYDEDQNGIFMPLAEYGRSADSEADYIWVHFDYYFPEKWRNDRPEKIIVTGQWTNDLLSNKFVLQPDFEDSRHYRGAFLLKQGYYSYYYWGVNQDGSFLITPSIEGNFYQTENEYTLLLYYRAPEDRYTRLIGAKTIKYIK